MEDAFGGEVEGDQGQEALFDEDVGVRFASALLWLRV